MNRSLVCVLLVVVALLPLGCGKPPETASKPIAQKSEIPDLVQRLKNAQMPLERRVVLNQLKSLGADANTPEVLAALEATRKKVVADERKLVDETIAAIKGTAPPAADAKK